MGGRRVDWSMEDVCYLLDSAGAVPKRQICQHLRRSAKSVERMADRLRRQGHNISLRHYEPRAITCPSCGRRSLTAHETGICRPCQLRRRLTAINGQIADLMARLPAEARAVYEATEAELGNRVRDPMPRMPSYRTPPTRYERARDEERFDRAMEEWEARRIERDVRAAQKRKERIQRKLREL